MQVRDDLQMVWDVTEAQVAAGFSDDAPRVNTISFRKHAPLPADPKNLRKELRPWYVTTSARSAENMTEAELQELLRRARRENARDVLLHNPQLCEFMFDDTDGRQWGVRAWGAGTAAAVPVDPATSFGLTFVCEDGEQRSVELVYYQSVDDFQPAELIRVWAAASVTHQGSDK